MKTRHSLAFWLLVSFVVLLDSTASARPYRRKYKHYLNVEKAEEVLSGIVLNRRLYDDEWLNILGPERKTETYKVKKGDTLWGISRGVVVDPKFWRKFWQMNPFLTNPHEIEVGTLLTLYQARGDDAAIRIPLVRLLAGGNTDLDSDSIVIRNTKNQFRPRIMVITDDDILGEIMGGYTEKEAFNTDDEFYLSFIEDGGVKPGTRYSIVRVERRVNDSNTSGSPNLGDLARLVGEVIIVNKGEELYKAEIKAMYGTIRRGDKVIALQPPVKTDAVFNPPPDLETKIVMGEEEERTNFGQGDLILLNKGVSDGMKVGYQFRVYRDQDPNTKRRDTVEPNFKGEVQVISAGEVSSVGLVIRNRDPLFVGDELVPFQNFPNPPPTVGREAQTIELD